MRKRLLSFLLTVLVAFLGLVGLTACDDETGAVTFGTYKIGGRVTYTYVINDGEEQTTTKASTGITLNEGDVIKVKASCKNVGYTDSDWATATYTANA